MRPCCVQTLSDIQEAIKNGKILTLMLKAAPYVILAPEFPVTADAEAIRNFLLAMATDKAVEKLVKGYPEMHEVVENVPIIVQETLQNLIVPEIIKHPGGPENRFWQKLNEAYGG